ncbi:chitin synthase-domain-containing protein [Mycena epipterygia]|nr:chitin synthase-domain-containing protein [Mycena epipterygia]
MQALQSTACDEEFLAELVRQSLRPSAHLRDQPLRWRVHVQYAQVRFRGCRSAGRGARGACGALINNNAVEEVPSSHARRVWLAIVWTLTFYIPSFLMKFLGRMKHPNVRLAWHEKMVIFLDVFKQQLGQDITKSLNTVLDAMVEDQKGLNMDAVHGAELLPHRRVAILMASMGMKFLAALQLGSKRNSELQDKFVPCQLPCYTEGEDSLQQTVDSLAALNYDDKCKLICDGDSIGSGNDHTMLGHRPEGRSGAAAVQIDGGGLQGAQGLLYSSLYEFEDHVVPYMVVVKGRSWELAKRKNLLGKCWDASRPSALF